jgi:tetratricopeptide (TPR) repeat protein
MRLAMMSWEERVAEITAAKRLEDSAAAEGATYGPLLLRRQPAAWRRMMRADAHCRGYGTLKFLLEAAHDMCDTQPTIARQLTSAVLDFVETAEAPSLVHHIGLRGLAWKEHANACEAVGDLRAALKAAERAIEIYGTAASLHFDQTRARLVACRIHREMGHADEALALARSCAEIFVDYGNPQFVTMARVTEGTVLFALKRFQEALAVFIDLIEQAERHGDKMTLARCLNNAAECARELGDLKSARDLYPRALAHFEELYLPAECTRVRWGYALSIGDEGNLRRAMWELQKVRAEYLALGMNSHAASAALDLVRFRFEAGDDVRDLCSEIVQTFIDAGMTQNAIEALAYLREQAKQQQLSKQKIARVRRYFDELPRKPTLLFERTPQKQRES